MAPAVSILIPARNEIYLEKTIRDILSNARGEIEVLAALDGWLPEPVIDLHDDRVMFYHFQEPIGHRAATNYLARQAKGKFIMKLDAHCAVDEGFDLKLAEDCEYDWTVIPRMYNLDVETWRPKFIDHFERAARLGKLNDYLYMAVNEKGELRTEYYKAGRITLHVKRKDILIDDTMSCMGPCFFMHKDRFFELDGCDEWMGPWGQQAVEVACKAWLSGGSLKVNKKTWFAHWFRHSEGWPYPISGNQINKTRRETTDFWINDKWPKAKRKFKWLLDKFNPPGWEKGVKVGPQATTFAINKSFYWRKQNLPWYPRRGTRNDLMRVLGELGFRDGVEVGTRQGKFAEGICKTIPNARLTCVDPWSQSKLMKYYKEACERLAKYNVSIIRKTSMDAVGLFKDNSLDFVYIDGDHAFDFVMMDIIRWSPKVKSGGVVAVHDFDNTDIQVAVESYMRSHNISPWYKTREFWPTAFWVKP